MRKTLTSLSCGLFLATSAFAADTVPWSNDFSNNAASISGYRQTKYHNSSKGYTVSSGELYLAEGASNASYHNEAWIVFTGDGFQLEKGKGYKFEMKVRTNSTSETAENNFRVMLIPHTTTTFSANLGQAASTIVGPDGSAIQNYIGTPVSTIISAKNVRGTDQQSFTGFFEVNDNGIYDLCLYTYTPTAHTSNANKSRAFYFDDFNLTYGSMDAPDAPALTITPDASGVLKAEIKATAPTKTIRGDVLTSVTKMEVYRDGGLVKEFANVTPGTSVTFTDYVAQPGNHTYSVLPYNENGPGQEYKTMTTIGGLPETQTWDATNYVPYWAKYTPEGKIRIEFPAVADRNNVLTEEGLTYKVQTMSGRILTGTPVEFTRVTHQVAQDQDREVKMYYIIDDAFEAAAEPIGYQYKVSTVDENGTETHRGYTNYICLNNEVPYYPNMTTTTALQAFTLDNDNSFGWQYNQSGGGQLMSSVSRPYGYADKNYFYNNWLISPGLKLSKDKFYRVKVTSASDNGTVTYTIKAGKGSYREALDIIVTEDHPTVTGNANMDAPQTDEMFLSVPEDGMYFVGLMPSIPASVSSTSYRMRRFDIIEVDPTLPDAPTDVTVAYSTTTGGKGNISYTVPSKAINGKDVEGLTKIEILKNGEEFGTVTEGVTPGAKLSFEIDVTAGKTDVYAIRAYNAAGQGESASATVFVLSTPYLNNFSSKNALNGFTMINNLNNGQNFHIQNDACRLFYSEMGNDHWLIMPPVTLTAGQYYQFNYNLKATSDGAGDCVVMMGKAPSAEAMDQTITEKFEINAEKNIFNGLHEEWFTVEESGQYFIGFHLTKDPGYHNKEIYIDDLQIAAGVAGTTPDKGVLKVTPAADASLKATLSYTVPMYALNGTPLNANSTQAVYFYINNVQTGGVQPDGTENPSNRTFNAYPGQTVSIDVTVPADLPYIFKAHSGWNGRPTYTDAFVGLNIPDHPDPDAIELKETLPYGHIVMNWDAVTKDYEGYDMNPDNIRYEVMKLVPNPANPENLIEQAVLTDIKGTTCEFDAIGENEAQTMVRYVLRARNIMGKGSQGVLTKYVNVGKPYRMPYQESFSSANKEPGVRTAIFSETLDGSVGAINWGIMTDGLDKGVTSGDGDGCYLAMEVMWIGGKGRFYTGKVNLGSGEKPMLTFMLYNPSAAGDDAPNLLQPMIYTVADGKWHELDEARSVSELTKNRPGWNKVSYDLSKYADNVAIIALDATSMKHTFTSVDNIRIWEAPAIDLSILSHDAPISVSPGKEFAINVNVANSGTNRTVPESIEMYADGKLISSLDGVVIEAGESTAVKFTHAFPAVDLATSHELSFKVNSEADADLTDNEISVKLATVNTQLPGVENLSASVNNDTNIVTLDWNAPAAASEERITEDFENFEAGDASQFGWTNYDRDGRAINGFTDAAGNALTLPGLTKGSKAAFAVIDVEKGPLPASQFPAASGAKYLMAMPPASEVGSADDWIISPLLSGKAQTITFKLRTMPGYRIGIEALYSEGGMNINDFKEITTVAINYGDWQGLMVEVPEGAKRFAFRNLTYAEDMGVLMLDDISYDPATGDEVALEGYNVYSENDCLAQPKETTYTLPEYHAKGEYVYGVSTRYAHGESKVTPIKVEVLTSGVTEVSVADGIHIFGGKGCIHITGAEGENVAVYDLNGQELANGQVSESGQIAAAPGVDVVVAGSRSQKVLVK